MAGESGPCRGTGREEIGRADKDYISQGLNVCGPDPGCDRELLIFKQSHL